MSEKSPTQRHFVYVVRCSDDTLYTGYATDVERRVAVHNAGRGAKYTRARLPVELVAFQEFPDKHAALGAEHRFKRLSRADKLARLQSARLRCAQLISDEELGSG